MDYTNEESENGKIQRRVQSHTVGEVAAQGGMTPVSLSALVTLHFQNAEGPGGQMTLGSFTVLPSAPSLVCKEFGPVGRWGGQLSRKVTGYRIALTWIQAWF